MKKVIFVSNSGGHLTELLKLSSLFNNYETLIVTDKTNTSEKITKDMNTIYLKNGSRQYIFKYIYVLIYNTFKSLNLILKFKPDVIVTTGAFIGGILCFIGKLFNKKVIYIESIARVNDLSLTGKLVYKFADIFYVQWEELTLKYKKSKYLGRLI